MTSGGQVYYFAYDQVGSLRAIFDSTGALVKQVDYDSFGNVLSDSNPVFTVPFGFAGGLHDRDTGLVRFGARDYDPATGKWTAKDPIDFGGGDLNILSYTGQDPVNWVDPVGLKIDWGSQVLSNMHVRMNLIRLNEAIIAMGIPDNCFTIQVTGGDRYRGIYSDRKYDYLVARSRTNNLIIWNAATYSRHLEEMGARAVDIVLYNVEKDIFIGALKSTSFDSYLDEDDHIHLGVPEMADIYPVY